MSANIVLFICTGNYYRSRFAEELFNFLSPSECPGWNAISRGLAVNFNSSSDAPIADVTVRALRARGVNIEHHQARVPLQLDINDLELAHHVVALSYSEHHAALRTLFYERNSIKSSSPVEYWHIPDTDQLPSADAFPEIDRGVLELMRRLRRIRRARARD